MSKRKARTSSDDPEGNGWTIVGDAPTELTAHLPGPAAGRYVLVEAPTGRLEDGRVRRGPSLALAWEKAGRQVWARIDRAGVLRGRPQDATWLPSGWTVQYFPTGLELHHLVPWFDWALRWVSHASLHDNRQDIPGSASLPTPRALLSHAYMIVDHLLLLGAPDEPTGETDRAGCESRIRTLWSYIRRGSQPAAPAAVGPGRPRPKRSTAKGGAPDKIIAALSAYHRYEQDSGLNTEPIEGNELARRARVGNASVSRFFKSQFGDDGHHHYCMLCHGGDSHLGAWLRGIRREGFGRLILYGRTPPGEGKRDE